jgi:uncharacterized membrane protein
VIIQPVTGIITAGRAGFSLTTPWLLTAIIVYLLTGACWLPVVWLQIVFKSVVCLRWPAVIGVPAVF